MMIPLSPAFTRGLTLAALVAGSGLQPALGYAVSTAPTGASATQETALVAATQEKTPPASQRKAAKYVIRTTQGRSLRGLARLLDDGSVEFKSGGKWIHLPSEQVAGATPEKEVLAELARRKKDPSIAAADQLDWALDQGLLTEGIRLGDELIEARPQDLDLRGVCSSAARILSGMPQRGAQGELASLRNLGSRGRGFVREAVIERVMTAAPRAELLAGFTADLLSKDVGVRSFALFALGRLFPKEDPRGVLLHSIYDPSKEARISAARAIGDFGASEVGRPLVDALGSETSAVRIRAAEALGHARVDKFVAPLMDRLYALSRAAGGASAGRPAHSYLFVGTQTAYIQDFDVEVAQFSSVADPIINTLTTGSVLDVGVINTSQVTILQEIATVRRSLGRITGQGKRWKARQWKKWWQSDASLPYRGPEGAAGEKASPPSSHGRDTSDRN